MYSKESIINSVDKKTVRRPDIIKLYSSLKLQIYFGRYKNKRQERCFVNYAKEKDPNNVLFLENKYKT